MFSALSILSAGLTSETGNYSSVPTQITPQVSAKAAPTASEEPAETWRTFTATAYVADCAGCSGITKTGVDVRRTITHEGWRVIAVDPAVIPLGSTVEVRLADGNTFEATAQDVGGAIDGAEIDVLMADVRDALEFGRQAVEVRVIDEN